MGKKASIKANYLYNVCFQVVNILAPLITTPYVSRILRPEGIGEYSYINSIVTYFITLAILGSAPYAQREISYRKDNRLESSCLFWEMVLFRVITTVVSLLLYTIVIYTVPSEVHIFYIFQGLNILAVAADITWFFQGLEEFKKITTCNLAIRSVNIILVFTMVKTKEDLWKYCLIISGLTLLGNIAIWGYLSKYLVKISVHKLRIKQHWKGIFQLFIPTIAVYIYRALDKFMIGQVSSGRLENGYYEQADKIVHMCMMIAASFSTVMAPRIAAAISQKDGKLLKVYMYKTFDFLMFITLPMAVGLIVISDLFIPWFLGEGYDKTIFLLKIFAPIIVIVSLSNATGMQYLIQARKQTAYTVSICIGAGVNFLANLVLIPYFYSVGAAVASVLAETFILVIQLWYICNKIKAFELKQIFRKCWSYLTNSMVMLCILVILAKLLPQNLFGIVLLISIGVFIYGGLLCLKKDELLVELFTGLKNKIKFGDKND